jgi:tRNA pseudouridine38-40 synthase
LNTTFYTLEIQYKGTRYLGWQKQKDFEPTVQDALEDACSKIFKTREVFTVGSGRTDSGVHSLGHIVKLKAPFSIPYESLLRGINSHLPNDIRVMSVSGCDIDFLPTNHALKKEYIYLFSNLKDTTALQDDFIVNNRFELNISNMKKACRLFIGKHDFKNFYCVGSDINSTIREIFECDLQFKEMDFHGILPNHYVFRITGNGFLKQMVRLIVGTIWEVGRGKVTLIELEEELKSPGDKKLGITAPPNGLFKTKVWYE